jgi:hypothetical protein
VNREEVNWLLQTIADGETTERFVSALCERVNFLAGDGRCGTRTRSDKPQRESIRDHGDSSLGPIPRDGTTSCYGLRGAADVRTVFAELQHESNG